MRERAGEDDWFDNLDNKVCDFLDKKDWFDNLDNKVAQRCQPRNTAQSSLNYHRSNALQKDNDAIYDIVHDRVHMRTKCVKGQQHANNLRRNNAVNIAEIMCKLVNQQSAPETDIHVFGRNPLEFHYFMVVFDEAVEEKIEDPRRILTRLIKYTIGESNGWSKIAYNFLQRKDMKLQSR